MKIHHSIGANLDLKQIATIFVAEIPAVIKCDGCAVLFIRNQQVKVLAEQSKNSIFANGLTIDFPIIKQIIETKETYTSVNISNSPELSCLSSAKVRSVLCVPIIIEDVVKGIFHIDSWDEGAFQKDDQELLELLTKELALAIERSLLYQRVKEVSITDSLTNCYNRAKFNEDLSHEIKLACCYEKSLTLIIIDIDYFKNYNDYHGHVAGDSLLREFTATLKKGLRNTDNVYRYGGEEFAILLPETDKSSAECVAKNLLYRIANTEFWGAQLSQPDKKITCSAGIANFPADTMEKTRLVEYADSALYKAKRMGRNAACNYERGA